MQEYELLLIIDGSIAENEALDIAKKLTKPITTNKGQIIELNSWGRRKLAYPINKKSFGYYFIIFYKDSGISAKPIMRQVDLDDFALKCIITKSEDAAAEQEFFSQLQANPRLNADLYSNYTDPK